MNNEWYPVNLCGDDYYKLSNKYIDNKNAKLQLNNMQILMTGKINKNWIKMLGISLINKTMTCLTRAPKEINKNERIRLLSVIKSKKDKNPLQNP